jgi:hypothetical protein
MVAGQSYAVSVTLRNTGTTTWNTGGTNPHKLGAQSPDFNRTWGDDTVALPGPVAPGQEVTISFVVRAPSLPGAYPFQWRMFQHMVELFGEQTPGTTVRVSAQAP